MKFRLLILIVLTSALLSACSWSLAADVTPPPGYIPPTPRPTLGPLYPRSAPDPQNGAALYIEKCEPCHGPTGAGDGATGKQLPVTVAAIGFPEVARQAAPAAWFQLVSQGNLDRFMPPFINLSEQERWDVVAYALTLSTSDEQIALGRSLYEANCQECHGPGGDQIASADLTDQAGMASLSAADLYRIIDQGAEGAMPSYNGRLSADQIWALTAFLRNLTFAEPVPATATPAPSETPIPTETSISAGEGTPEAVTTPSTAETPVAEATAAVETVAASVTVTGQLVHGGGGPIPAGQIVTLDGFEHGTTDTGEFLPVYTATAEVGPDGTFSFSDLPMLGVSFYIVSTDYGDLTYTSAPAFLDPTLSTYDLPLTVYDTTTDQTALRVDRWHIFLNFDQPGIVQVVEVLIVSNPGLETVIGSGEDEIVLSVPLPEGASNLQFEDGSLGDGRYLQTADGFADTQPIGPGAGQYQLLFAFDLPYDRKFELTQSYHLPVDAAIVMVPLGIEVKSDLLETMGPRDFQGVAYELFASAPLPAEGSLTLTISGSPDSADAGSGIDQREGLLIGVGALGVALIAIGGYLFWRDRNRQVRDADEEDDQVEEEMDEFDDAESVMDAIIALDDLHRAGKIGDEAYNRRRAALKAILKDLL